LECWLPATPETILEGYRWLERADIQACLLYARRMVWQERVDPALAGTEDPGDEQILLLAVEQARVVVTLDKDFGTLALLRKQPHCGINRLVDISPTRQSMACLSAIAIYANVLRQHGIVTVEPGRVRVRAEDVNPPPRIVPPPRRGGLQFSPPS
jgi:predicted nuclease of predicted toxin-antitoxin system